MIFGKLLVELGVEHAEVVFAGKDFGGAGLAVGGDDLRDAIADEFVILDLHRKLLIRDHLAKKSCSYTGFRC